MLEQDFLGLHIILARDMPESQSWALTTWMKDLFPKKLS